MSNAQHSSKSNEHYTPTEIVDAARTVIGQFDLDPASCAAAQAVVRATQYYTEADDGLTLPWSGRVFLNPPGGPLRENLRPILGTKSSAVGWWRRLVDAYTHGEVEAAVFVGFSLEILQASQGKGWRAVGEYPHCVPAKRLRFETIEADGARRPGKQPTHANVIAYLGPDPHTFGKVFSAFGHVTFPVAKV